MTFRISSFKFLISNFQFRASSFQLRVFILCVTFYILNTFSANAQEIKVVAKFSSDSIKLGKPIEVYLSAHYPEKLNVLFPDSTFAYTPFEFEKKLFFPTKTENGISKDSAIYFLTSYEVDSIQTLKLPIFVVNAMDCVQVFSNEDTVYFQNLVKHIPDSLSTEKLPLKANTNYLNVRWEFNTILLAIIGGALIIVLILVWIFFGKRIKKYFRIKRMTKTYESFKVNFENAVEKLDKDFSPQAAEQSLLQWKKYLETLLAKPYTKYTSKEIRAIENSEELGISLTAIDRMIYGHQHENVNVPFDSLKNYVHQQFEKKKAEVING